MKLALMFYPCFIVVGLISGVNITLFSLAHPHTTPDCFHNFHALAAD